MTSIAIFSLRPDENQEESGWANVIFRVVSGINGLCFFLLTVTLLNYGSRLEKIVHAIKIKSMTQQARSQGDAYNYAGQSNSSINNIDLAHEIPSVGTESFQSRLIANLDVRIFIVTIFLSVVLLSIAVTELLCSLKIIKDVSTFVEWKFLLYYFLSESVPSLTIACFLNSGN